MRSHVGIASKMFRVLSEEGINIQMISTSEIKTSVVIDEKYMELAVRAAAQGFRPGLCTSPLAADNLVGLKTEVARGTFRTRKPLINGFQET